MQKYLAASPAPTGHPCGRIWCTVDFHNPLEKLMCVCCTSKNREGTESGVWYTPDPLETMYGKQSLVQVQPRGQRSWPEVPVTLPRELQCGLHPAHRALSPAQAFHSLCPMPSLALQRPLPLPGAGRIGSLLTSCPSLLRPPHHPRCHLWLDLV